jgi:hypothetical protein
LRQNFFFNITNQQKEKSKNASGMRISDMTDNWSYHGNYMYVENKIVESYLINFLGADIGK